MFIFYISDVITEVDVVLETIVELIQKKNILNLLCLYGQLAEVGPYLGNLYYFCLHKPLKSSGQHLPAAVTRLESSCLLQPVLVY